MQQRSFRIHDVIIRIYPNNITKTVKNHEIVGALQGYTDEQYLYMHTVDGNTLEIGIYDESEVK